MSDVPATSISGPREPSFVETTQISCEFLFQYATRLPSGEKVGWSSNSGDWMSGRADASFARDDKKIALPVAVRVEHDFLSIRGIARRPITARVRRQRAPLAAVERHDPQVQIPGAIGIQYELGAIW